MRQRKYDHTISMSARGVDLSMTNGGETILRLLCWASVEQAKFNIIEHTLDEMERRIETAVAT